MLNKVVLIGRLTKDPELRYTPNGKATCNFTLACDRPFKNAQGEKETDFIPCAVPPYRDKLAENCANYLSKGKMVAIDGRIQVRNYTGQDGQKHWVTEVIAEDVRFLSPKDEGATQAQQQSQAHVQVQSQPQYGAQPQNGFYPPQGVSTQSYSQPQGQPPAQNYPGNPPGQMPPPPGYQQQGAPNRLLPNGQQGQPQGGQRPAQGQQQQQYSFGHQVNMPDDQIPF